MTKGHVIVWISDACAIDWNELPPTVTNQNERINCWFNSRGAPCLMWLSWSSVFLLKTILDVTHAPIYESLERLGYRVSQGMILLICHTTNSKLIISKKIHAHDFVSFSLICDKSHETHLILSKYNLIELRGYLQEYHNTEIGVESTSCRFLSLNMIS